MTVRRLAAGLALLLAGAGLAGLTVAAPGAGQQRRPSSGTVPSR